MLYVKKYSYICKAIVQNMHNRLKQFLAAENISQSQFADEIGVARASVSHILAGRNRPGFEFIESMLLHYPALNSEWLITGKGKMYKEATTVHSAPDFSALEKVPELPLAPAPSSPQALPEQHVAIESNSLDNKQKKVEKQKNISKILIFYDDNSFIEVK